jgi:phage baseplate assembly protein W
VFLLKSPLIDANGDLVMKNGEIQMVDGDEELAQSVESILKTRQCEFFMDTEFGLSRDNLLGKQADQDAAHDDIVEAVAQEERVATVDNISFLDDRSARTRSISLSMTKADAGETVSLDNVGVES